MLNINNVLSIDWRTRLDAMWTKIGYSIWWSYIPDDTTSFAIPIDNRN